MDWHNVGIDKALKLLDVDLSQGLSSSEVIKRQKKYGKNILNKQKQKSLIIKFFSQFSDFMIITLIIAAGISFFISYIEGNPNFFEPLIILFIVTLNATLGVFQEAKAEKSLEALKKLSAPSTHVLRDRVVQIVDSAQLVPGDIILLEAGFLVSADARIIDSSNLKVEESSLTGESHPVEKYAKAVLKADTALPDRSNLVMATTMVTYGRGTAVVTHTGMNTEVGHIAKLILDDAPPLTPLQKRLSKTGKYLGISALIICVIIFILGIFKNAPIFDMFMTSVSLAVAAIPEGLPAIVTIMLSLGVQRMAQKNAVIRKLPAVETLGSATVICSDKTGTLTQNSMTVTEIASLTGEEELKGEFGTTLLSYGALCNDSIIQNVDGEIIITGEPTEKAIAMAAYEAGAIKDKLDRKYKRTSEIPFDSYRKLMTTLHRTENNEYKSITKGAYDFLIQRCNRVYYNGKEIPLTSEEKLKLSKLNSKMTSNALRVIAVAYKDIDKLASKNINPSSQEKGLCFMGLIGMIDPPRKEVKESVRLCKKAGIKPVMITGDHILTANAIARDLGILSPKDKSISGDELSLLSDEDLEKDIHKYSVFARVTPKHKVRIVKAFQNRNEVVAMTGDGVNDAPALKAADIGCAMGITGTDVSKNASDMILTDDNFATIVAAVREGRGIYDNITKAIHFLLSCNVGEIITIFVAILFGLPTPLLAVHLLWVNLVTDSLPAISLGMEPVEDDIMLRKPIHPDKGMFADGLMVKIIAEGILVGSLALTAFCIGIKYFDIEPMTNPIISRTMAFAVLSISQLFHAFNMRSNHSLSTVGVFSNSKLVLSFITCLFLQVIVISYLPLANIFEVRPLNHRQWLIVFFLSFMPIVILEIQKAINKKLKNL